MVLGAYFLESQGFVGVSWDNAAKQKDAEQEKAIISEEMGWHGDEFAPK